MPSLPLPYIIALLLLILLVKLPRQTALQSGRLLLLACVVLTLISGLRWQFSTLLVLKALQPVVASCLPPLAWLTFISLTERKPRHLLWLHVLPPVLVMMALLHWIRWQLWLDLVLTTAFLGYGVALLWLATQDQDALVTTRLSDGNKAHKAALVGGAALVCTGSIDVLVALDFQLQKGAHAVWIVAAADMVMIPLLAIAVALVGNSVASAHPGAPATSSLQCSTPPASAATLEDSTVLERVNRVLLEQALYCDPDLTLERLARKTGVTARQISAAINRMQGRNVSQMINQYRIEKAQQLLRETAMSITDIQLESGFLTKSNFNREFLRITGVSPSCFRRAGS
ncbi:helix-turn-helix domain-containing protein [Leeia sp.]|uniref:helix-turn-helix domain-containing protein n=1 Tax=Leeia sp. TaxID=2884678 RepID=UPI0035B1945D